MTIDVEDAALRAEIRRFRSLLMHVGRAGNRAGGHLWISCFYCGADQDDNAPCAADCVWAEIERVVKEEE